MVIIFLKQFQVYRKCWKYKIIISLYIFKSVLFINSCLTSTWIEVSFHEIICFMKPWKPGSGSGTDWEVSAYGDDISLYWGVWTHEPTSCSSSLVGRIWYSPLQKMILLMLFQEIQFLTSSLLNGGLDKHGEKKKKSWHHLLTIRLNSSG